ncbi:hypothetical protein [Spirosoma validum]|uniref:Uncharacterized protein n=1 Tax=Spirosoma validum TaxID=2771355 RepID=A0A927B5J1_9BACT|nr:hypothetical protein [Spirosoma validum]MBD2756050.1 hypothetical protein [Spirosoma validum]
MKTDRFTDIIRRKLESIRPEFTDKDWARMQSTLKDANLYQPNTPGANSPFSGGVWSGQSWLLAAASISTVALIAFSIWQRQEINQLRQTIGQLHPNATKQSAPVPSVSGSDVILNERVQPDVVHVDKTTSAQKSQETTASANRNESQAVRPDTVYITRYVPVPSRTRADVRSEIRSDERFSQHTETPPEQRYATDNPTASPVITRQPTNQTKNQQTESYDVSSTPSVAKNTNNESSVINKSTNTSVKPSNTLTNEKNSIGQTKGGRNRETRRNDVLPSTSADDQGNVVANTNVGDNKANPTETAGTTNETSATYETIASLPLSTEGINWGAALAQRAKRMRPARTTVVNAEPAQTQAQTPASQPVQQVATRFRAGVGGEVTSRLWSAGVFTEVLLGRHWTLGVGLSQATFLNRFITEEDFNDRTERDFRKEFARPNDAWRDILNIDTRQIRLQIPVSLGYRIPINQSLTFLPTAGMYLNLTNSENITYYCRDILKLPLKPQVQRGFDEINTTRSQPVALVSNFALTTGIEWQRSHWVVQASPVLNIPIQSNQQLKQPDLNWQKNTTVGLRARLLYQF